MILRKYGTTVQRVEPNFDARAMNEIGFQRTNDHSLAVEEFGSRYERVAGHELTASAAGIVQDETERELLRQLGAQLAELAAGLSEGQVLLVESEQGKDYPKTRERQRTIMHEGQNKLHFEWTVDPPLRVGIYAEKV